MTRLESAVSYFSKNNKTPKGSRQKIYAYELAEKSLRNTTDISRVLNRLLQDMITEGDACRQIASILQANQ